MHAYRYLDTLNDEEIACIFDQVDEPVQNIPKVFNNTSKQLEILIPYHPKITIRSKQPLRPTAQGDQSIHDASYTNTVEAPNLPTQTHREHCCTLREERTDDIHTLRKYEGSLRRKSKTYQVGGARASRPSRDYGNAN
jgi:hypothetical protein